MENSQQDLTNLKNNIISLIKPGSNVAESYLRYTLKHASSYMLTKAISELLHAGLITASEGTEATRTLSA